MNSKPTIIFDPYPRNEEMVFTSDVEKELNRTLELFKQMELEQKLEKNANQLEKLAQKQKELAQKTLDKKQDTAQINKEQKEIQKEFENIQSIKILNMKKKSSLL